MDFPERFSKALFSAGPSHFEEMAMALFHYQVQHCEPYGRYLDLLGVDTERIMRTDEIPHLPVGLFKSHSVRSGKRPAEAVFESSGTGEGIPARHEVADLDLYRRSIVHGYRRAFGDPGGTCFLALLPSYLERPGASLVHMCKVLMEESGDPQSGFYLDNLQTLVEVLQAHRKRHTPTMLIGVSFALLDLAERAPCDLQGITVVETGGMKGRRSEPTREALHADLCKAFNIEAVCSEYGMTELLSQAWSKSRGRFHCPPWMRVSIREPQDPFAKLPAGRTGGINIIDLANTYSCAFLETADLGRMNRDGSFEVLGRFDHSELRGCNLMLNQ